MILQADFNDRGYYKNNEIKIKHCHICDATSEKSHLELFAGDRGILKFINLAECNKVVCEIELNRSNEYYNKNVLIVTHVYF